MASRVVKPKETEQAKREETGHLHVTFWDTGEFTIDTSHGLPHISMGRLERLFDGIIRQKQLEAAKERANARGK